jgi:hypothetical protein
LTSKSQRRETLMNNIQQQVIAHWRTVNPHDGNQVQKFTERAAQITTAGQKQMVSLAAATQKTYFTQAGIDFSFIPEVADNVRLWSDFATEYAKPEKVKENGKVSERLPLTEPFNRVARDYRREIANGKSEDEALAKSIDRATIIVDENLALAEREAERQIIDKASKANPGKILGWRRVIHPEASKTGVCGLCIVAADRTYKVGELKALHARCKCETVPIFKNNDPGLTLNTQDLQAIYAAAGDTTSGRALKKVRYQIDMNKELGPQLMKAADSAPVGRYTKEQMQSASSGSSSASFAEKQIPIMQRTLNKLLAEGRSESDSAVQYNRRMIAKYKSEIAA